MHLTSKWLVWSLRFVTVYGLVLFIYYYFTKDVFEVPFLIVNLGDAGELYNKNNARGEFAKLLRPTIMAIFLASACACSRLST